MHLRFKKIKNMHKAICHCIGIAAGAVELNLWAYYGGLSIPTASGISAEAASVKLAPALQGFSISSGILAAISLAAVVAALINQNSILGIWGGIGLGIAIALTCTAIALAQYETLLLTQTIDETMACIEVICPALCGLILISEVASLNAK